MRIFGPAGALKSEGLLFVTALAWGMGYAIQKQGMEHIGPFAFNASRYFLAAVCLLPILPMSRRLTMAKETAGAKTYVIASLCGGFAIFLGASFQQSGLIRTSTANAGFITAFYTIIVPTIAVMRGQIVGAAIWIGACVALAGLYLLSFTGGVSMSLGDILTLIGAFFWATHVTLASHFSPRLDPIKFAIGQFLVCSACCCGGSFVFEGGDYSGFGRALPAILYAGCVSICIGVTLQIIAQQRAHPARAAVIMSLEAVFAAFAGWLILSEGLTPRAMSGCALMLAGIILAQWKSAKEMSRRAAAEPWASGS